MIAVRRHEFFEKTKPVIFPRLPRQLPGVRFLDSGGRLVRHQIAPRNFGEGSRRPVQRIIEHHLIQALVVGDERLREIVEIVLIIGAVPDDGSLTVVGDKVAQDEEFLVGGGQTVVARSELPVRPRAAHRVEFIDESALPGIVRGSLCKIIPLLFEQIDIVNESAVPRIMGHRIVFCLVPLSHSVIRLLIPAHFVLDAARFPVLFQRLRHGFGNVPENALVF